MRKLTKMVKLKFFHVITVSILLLIFMTGSSGANNGIACRGGRAKQAPWLSLSVTILANQMEISERVITLDKVKPIQQETMSNSTSEALFHVCAPANYEQDQPNFKCWSKNRPKLEVRWKQKVNMEKILRIKFCEDVG